MFEVYKSHCEAHGAWLVGTTLVIRGEYEPHDVACLFTSRAYGRRAPEEIIAATRSAVQDLVDQNREGQAVHAWYVPYQLL